MRYTHAQVWIWINSFGKLGKNYGVVDWLELNLNQRIVFDYFLCYFNLNELIFGF